ncbi:MAG: M1 family peptidase, partial [Candidatus Micrarchaeota archaeon]|nr:M1 family peptidase [Candidatus Micrarchaeota archaeon]
MAISTHKSLGNNVQPLNYRLFFVPDLKSFKTTVYEDINCVVSKPTRLIKLNAKELKVVSASAFSNGAVQLAKIKYDQKNEEVHLIFKKRLRGKIEIGMTSVCDNNDRLYGFYRSKYGDKGKEEYMLTSQFEPAEARAAFPCFDEPEMKATFEVSFIIDRKLEAISNTPIIEEHGINGGRKIIRFGKTPKMSTYLLYLGVGRFDRLDGRAGRLKVSVLTTPGKKHLAKLPLSYAIKFIRWYEGYFRIPFPLPKIDLIAVPDFSAGAMENWGAITFREIRLLSDENTSEGSKRDIAMVIAHELAHQWFGNLVTMKWWDDLWLNESFATYMSYKAMDAVFPKWEVMKQFAEQEQTRAFENDALKSTHPISVRIPSADMIPALFDRISYDKGGGVLYMLEDFVGSAVFKRGLRAYLRKFKYANARKEDLWVAIQKAATESGRRIPVSDVMQKWVTTSGHPIIESKGGGKLVTLRQRSFTISGTSRGGWPIPVHALLGNRESSFIMRRESEGIGRPPGLLLLNYGQKGLYRVSYDD